MLRRSLVTQKHGVLKSTVQKKLVTWRGGKGFAVQRTRSDTVSNKGFGSGFALIPKQRLFRMPDTGVTVHEHADTEKPLGRPSKTLSSHWRPFALADGGVLLVHPSTKQVLEWSMQVTKHEQAATGLSAKELQTNTKIQQILEDSAVEHTPLSQWRRQHMWALVEQRAGVRRPAPGLEEDHDGKRGVVDKYLW